MFGPEKIDRELARTLARDLHKRQVIEFLINSGMKVQKGSNQDTVLATDTAGRKVITKFESDGSFLCTTEDGRSLKRRFDEHGDLEEISDSGGLNIALSSEPDGSRKILREGHGEYIINKDPFALPTEITYPDGGKVRFDLEEDGGETVKDQLGGVSKAHRDDNGRLTGVTDRNGHTTSTGEKNLQDGGSALWLSTPGGRHHEYELNALGDLKKWTLNGLNVAEYTGKTASGLPQEAHYHDGHWVRFETDGDRIVAAHNPNGTVELTYDDSGRIICENQNGLKVSYDYDPAGFLTAIILPDGEKVQFRYDKSGKLSAVNDLAGETIFLDWSPNGQVASISHPNGVASTIKSNQLGLITDIETSKPKSGVAPILDLAFFYDACDRLTTMRDGKSEHQYQYDVTGQLLGTVASEREFNEKWQYDLMGNKISSNGVPWAFDSDNCISGAGNEAISYDIFGRTQSLKMPAGRGNLHYNGQGQLMRAEISNGAIAEYGYDAFGRRTWKRLNSVTTRYLWAGQIMICEWNEGGGPWQRRDHLFFPGTFLPLSMRVDGKTFSQHCDHRGAPQAMTDENGAVVWRAQLKAFGSAIISQQTVQNPWRLANQYCDDETGLHYNLARYMHPDLGRYLTPDTLFDPANRGNLYIYASNDPLNQCDPTGEILPLLAAVAVGAAVGAVIGGAVKAYQTRNEPWSWGRVGKIAGAALIGGAVGAVGGATGFGVTSLLGMGAAAASTTGAAIGSLMVKGGVEGAITSVVEACTEATLTGELLTPADIALNAIVGGGIGMVTAGIGGKIATRAMRKKIAKETEESITKQLIKRFSLDEAKYKYFFGHIPEPNSSLKTLNPKKYKKLKNNYDRSIQIKNNLKEIGIEENKIGRKKLDDIFNQGLENLTKEKQVSEYGESVKGIVQEGNMLIEVMYFYPSGSAEPPRVTSIIPKRIN